MSYQIHLEVFEGPFDLLLHLIHQNQVDIYDIPISLITDQYLAFLEQMKQMDLEVASSFLVMAATLLAIKAKMLLPSPPGDDDEPEDARSELVRDLMEYMIFKEAAERMEDIAQLQHQYFPRPNADELYLNLFSDENPLAGTTLDDLRNAFAVVVKKATERGMVMHIEKDQVTLKDRLEYLYNLISNHPKGIVFSAVFASCTSKMALIVTFLALLELIRQSVAKISQSSAYAEIYLYPGDLSKYDRDSV